MGLTTLCKLVKGNLLISGDESVVGKERTNYIFLIGRGFLNNIYHEVTGIPNLPFE